MNKKFIPFKILYYLSLIPFLGLLISWVCSWLNIYNRTGDRKYIFLHFLIWIFPMCIVGAIVGVCTTTFMVNLSMSLKTIWGLIIGYFAFLIMSISCVGISQGIIKKFDKNSLIWRDSVLGFLNNNAIKSSNRRKKKSKQ